MITRIAAAVVLIVALTGASTCIPAVPTGLAGVAVSGSQINLSWNASTGAGQATGYGVFRNGAKIGSTGLTTAYTDTGLSPSTHYSYTVDAFDAVGNTSAQSAPVIITTTSNPCHNFRRGRCQD